MQLNEYNSKKFYLTKNKVKKIDQTSLIKKQQGNTSNIRGEKWELPQRMKIIKLQECPERERQVSHDFADVES